LSRARPAARRGSLASPRYHQVYVTLRSWVRDGSYRAGERIPTEPELCRLFGVSRITIRKAIDELSREGWLLRQQGRGTFVQLSAARTVASIDLDEARQQVAGFTAATEVVDLAGADVEPDEETRAALQLGPDARVRRSAHVRQLRGVRLGLITTYVPTDVAARVGEEALARQSMFELLDKAGIDVAEADQLIGATLAGVEAALALGVEVGAPLLRLTRVVFDAAGRPVERVVALYRADAYQYHTRLRRTRDAG
jgi:GntR family transcriptional regulator